MKHDIILFYLYTSIADPENLKRQQTLLCESFGIKGRMIIAHEGINGTLGGIAENIEKYIREISLDERFSSLVFKHSEGDENTFPGLSIKVRKDIVSNAIADWGVDPTKETGKYLAPEELHQWLRGGRDFEIIDMRNDYEHQSGHFENSLLAPIRNFRELPNVVEAFAPLKEKTVVTVCTGGVRCEKASALLIRSGFKDVYQLHGGIHAYMEKYPNQDFNGSLYVFDQRVVTGFNLDSPEHRMLGRCIHCSKPSENYINCSNSICHLHFIVCKECLSDSRNSFCSDTCKNQNESFAKRLKTKFMNLIGNLV